jgi:hypothetical protein
MSGAMNVLWIDCFDCCYANYDMDIEVVYCVETILSMPW